MPLKKAKTRKTTKNIRKKNKSIKPPAEDQNIIIGTPNDFVQNI